MANIISPDELPVLTRREVEARILKPFLEALEQELGTEKTIEIITKAITKDALAHGAKQAELHGSNKLEDLPAICSHHSEGGSLDVECTRLSENKLLYKTLRCEYCDMYKRLGMEKWGPYLSCMRDEAFFKGINPDFAFERTQTLMTGGECCDSVIIDTKGEN